MQRAAEARTSTKVSSISRMTMRIIFAGSSDRSSISVMFAAKMSRVREKILIQSLRNANQGPKPAFYYTRVVPTSTEWLTFVFFAIVDRKSPRKSLPNRGITHQQSVRIRRLGKGGAGGIFHRAKPGVSRRGRASEPRGAAQSAGPCDR